jgi:hypothetical protein
VLIFTAVITTKTNIMTTIKTQNGYKMEFNGKGTFIITDDHNDCLGYFDTERKANNFFKKTLRLAGFQA